MPKLPTQMHRTDRQNTPHRQWSPLGVRFPEYTESHNHSRARWKSPGQVPRHLCRLLQRSYCMHAFVYIQNQLGLSPPAETKRQERERNTYHKNMELLGYISSNIESLRVRTVLRTRVGFIPLYDLNDWGRTSSGRALRGPQQVLTQCDFYPVLWMSM